MGRRTGTVLVYEVLFDGPEDGPSGPAGDGTFIQRFPGNKAGKAAAETFAAANTCYGRPATVSEAQPSRQTARRWGMV